MDTSKVVNTTFIYALCCPTSGQVRYIGKSDNPSLRLANHIIEARQGGTHRRHWINSLTQAGLKPELFIVDECLYEEWGFWEQHYIDLYSSWGCPLVNSAGGGVGGKMSYESNQKRIRTLTGKKYSAERVAKAAAAKTGIHLSQETKAKMSAAHKGKKVRVGQNVGAVNPRAKRVRQLTMDGQYIMTWAYVKLATKFYRIRCNSIMDVCKGRLVSAAGYRWELE